MICAAYIPFVAGSEVFSYALAERLAKQGHDIHIVTGKWDSNLKDFEIINRVNVHRVPVIRKKNFRLLSFVPYAVKKAEEIAKDSDLIHANLAFSAGFIGAIVKGRTKKPLMITVQGGDLADYKENTGKFKGVLKPLIRYALSNADLVHAISNHTERLAKQLGAKNIHKVPLGFDPNIFHRMKVKRDPNLLISVSRLTPKNGISYLLKSMKLITLKYPNLRLLLVGDGEQRRELEGFVNRNKLQYCVKFIGNVKHKNIAKLLNKASIFVRPSIDEGLGIAFLEAMACRTPVIGTRTGGIPEIITNNRTGLLVEPANYNALASAISRLIDDKSLSNRLSKNGLKNSKLYHWDNLTIKIVQLYNEILSHGA